MKPKKPANKGKASALPMPLYRPTPVAQPAMPPAMPMKRRAPRGR